MVQAQNPKERLKEVIDEPPPFLGRWPRVYAFVLIWLTTLVLLFYWFSQAFAA